MHQQPIELGRKEFGRLSLGFLFTPQKGLLTLNAFKTGILFRQIDIPGFFENGAKQFFAAFDENDARDIINYEISCL